MQSENVTSNASAAVATVAWAEGENNTYSHVTMDWPQSVYYAWVLYGAVSFQLSLYWIQRFYMQNWYGLPADYLSGKPYLYTYFGIGETINRLVLICMWSLSAVFWLLTLFKAEELYWFFTFWSKILHFIDVLRILFSLCMKTIGIFDDVKTDYLVDDGTNLDTGFSSNVSMAQELSGTDWYMEAFGLTVSFSLYGDLLGISAWAWKEQAKCIKSGICQAKDEKTQEEIDEINATLTEEEDTELLLVDIDLESTKSEEQAPGWAADTTEAETEFSEKEVNEFDDEVDSDLELEF